MYLNRIKFKGSVVYLFLTTTECFSPENPVYKAVQVRLKEIGYDADCNHVFIGELGKLIFGYDEIDNYFPEGHILDYIKQNRQQLNNQLVYDLIYIFSTDVTAEQVKNIIGDYDKYSK